MKELVIFKYFKIMGAALLWAMLSAAPTAAQSPAVRNIFEIRDVHVDVTAVSAAVARDQAISEGQRQALTLLFRKIVMDEDLAKIPTLEDSWVNDLVQGFEVNKEKTSGIRYIADLTVSFNREGVFSLLQRLGIPFSQTEARPMLFLGLQRYGGTTILWSEQNWWSAAWGRADTANRLLTFIMPLGETGDRLAINAEQAFKVDPVSLAAMVKKYNVEDALIVTATITQDFQNGAYLVHADAKKWPISGTPISVDLMGRPNETFEALLDRAVVALTKRLEDDWKRLTLIYFGKTRELAVRVPLNSLEDWLTIKNRLGNVGAVRQTRVDGLSVTEAALTLSYSGQPGQLAQALAQTNIILVERAGKWSLHLKREESRK